MAVIRPSALNPAENVPTNAAIPLDTGSEVVRATPEQIVDAAIPLASESEAVEGSNNTKRVTPLRVKQAMDANMATTAALASTDPGKGDAMVGSDDGASGTLWTTVKGFIAYLRSSAGSTVLGFKLGAGAIVSAVQRTIAHKLSERITPLDFGAAGDADPDDNTAGTDDTAAVQAALDYCASNPGTSLCLAGRFYKVQWCRVPHRDDERRFFIFGEGGGFVNPATSSSEAPCLYHSALANSGDASRTYNYSMGVTLDGVNFHGGGYGVGYMHAIAGHLHHANCSWQRLESGLLTSGVAGIFGKNTTFKECERGHYAARIADIAWTAGYTQEPSTGWNDGVHYDGGRMRDCVRGILHRGSTSEGVLTVRNMILTGGYQSYVETHGDMHSVEISGTWCEYSRADESGDAQVDVFRFLDASGTKGGAGGEANGRFYVHDNVFFFSTPQPDGGVTRYAVLYGIYAEVRNLTVKGNFVHPGSGAVYTGFVYNNSGSNRIPIPAATSVTPASTTDFNSAGQISIAGTDIDALGSKYSFFYMTDTGASPAKTYLLKYHSTVSSNYIYTVHQFQYVYSGQFPMHNANWDEATPTMLNRIRPSGISVDLVNATTGLTFTGPTITLSPGINGSVSYDGANRGALAIVEDNVLLGFDMTKVWQQGSAGGAILRNNTRGS
jgi:hypothetical protein